MQIAGMNFQTRSSTAA
ncbi:DUF6783 domain-containing protein [Eisenbergiella tayi]